MIYVSLGPIYAVKICSGEFLLEEDDLDEEEVEHSVADSNASGLNSSRYAFYVYILLCTYL
jgi:hypothetical protein